MRNLLIAVLQWGIWLFTAQWWTWWPRGRTSKPRTATVSAPAVATPPPKPAEKPATAAAGREPALAIEVSTEIPEKLRLPKEPDRIMVMVDEDRVSVAARDRNLARLAVRLGDGVNYAERAVRNGWAYFVNTPPDLVNALNPGPGVIMIYPKEGKHRAKGRHSNLVHAVAKRAMKPDFQMFHIKGGGGYYAEGELIPLETAPKTAAAPTSTDGDLDAIFGGSEPPNLFGDDSSAGSKAGSGSHAPVVAERPLPDPKPKAVSTRAVGVAEQPSLSLDDPTRDVGLISLDDSDTESPKAGSEPTTGATTGRTDAKPSETGPSSDAPASTPAGAEEVKVTYTSDMAAVIIEGPKKLVETLAIEGAWCVIDGTPQEKTPKGKNLRVKGMLKRRFKVGSHNGKEVAPGVKEKVDDAMGTYTAYGSDRATVEAVSSEKCEAATIRTVRVGPNWVSAGKKKAEPKPETPAVNLA